MNRFLVILFLQIPLFLLAQDKLQFIGERIDFELNNSRFSINGIYFFANSTNREIRQTIVFPFAQEADSITVKRVFNLTYNQNIRYQLIDKGISFKIIVLPKDTVNVNISYSQMTEHENIYVLNSIQTWNKALQTAKYSLTFDESVSIDNVSYQPDKIDGNVYYWDIKDFYPKENFKIIIE